MKQNLRNIMIIAIAMNGREGDKMSEELKPCLSVEDIINVLRRFEGHYYVDEDTFYSCVAAKYPDGTSACCDDERIKRRNGECDCGLEDGLLRKAQAIHALLPSSNEPRWPLEPLCPKHDDNFLVGCKYCDDAFSRRLMRADCIRAWKDAQGGK